MEFGAWRELGEGRGRGAEGRGGRKEERRRGQRVFLPGMSPVGQFHAACVKRPLLCLHSFKATTTTTTVNHRLDNHRHRSLPPPLVYFLSFPPHLHTSRHGL